MVCINFRNVIVILIPSYGIHRVTSRSPPPLYQLQKQPAETGWCESGLIIVTEK